MNDKIMDEKEKRIEALRAKRHEATIKLSEMVKERNKAQRTFQNWNKKVQAQATLIRSFSREIGMIKTGEKQGKVTDHAIVRYLERYKGVDIEQIANEILEHPDAKVNESGLVSTVFKEDAPLSKDAADILRLARLKKVIPNGQSTTNPS